MHAFVYEQPAARVLFGPGALARIDNEVARLKASRALIVCTRSGLPIAEQVQRRLGDLAAGIFADAVMHHPVEVIEAAREQAARIHADCYVAIGGGTSTGTAKLLALDTSHPIVAIPTTYAGSEMTSIYGMTDEGVKRTGRDPRARPRSVIYDPELTLTLPAHVSGTSGINALAHGVEALYAWDGNSVTSLMATESIRALARALPIVVREPANLEARSGALYGAWLAGMVLGTTSMGLHHKLCHTLGGSFNLPHAEVHTVILPHVMAYNSDAAPDAMRAIADALGTADAATGIFDLIAGIGAPTSLKAIGMPEDGLDRAAQLAVQHGYPNPMPVERRSIRLLLQRAFDGVRP